MSYNFVADSFHKRNFVADFLKCNFRRKTAILRFEPSFGGLGPTYDDHLRLIRKRLVDFLLVLIEPFFARCYGWGATSEYRFKIGDLTLAVAGWPIISRRSGRPQRPFFFLEN